MIQSVQLLWNKDAVEGRIEVSAGTITRLESAAGSMETGSKGALFAVSVSGREGDDTNCKMLVSFENVSAVGGEPVLVTVDSTVHPFTFRLQDVDADYPIYIADYGVIVTTGDDRRTYAEIEAEIRAKGLLTTLARIESEPEESYEIAAAHTKNLSCQTWLGLSRDVRMFAVGLRGVGGEDLLWDWIQPKKFGMEHAIPENDNRSVRYRFLLGRGIGCTEPVTRRLEDGVLPILHGRIDEDDIVYEMTTFTSYEYSPLNEQTLRGTNYLVADGFGHGHMLTEEQKKQREEMLIRQNELERNEETVLYLRAKATNNGQVPRYAWFKNAVPNAFVMNNDNHYTFDGTTGFSHYSDSRVFNVTLMNGKALEREETAILLKPGESVVFDMYLPHSPISPERAAQLSKQSFEARIEECRRFWQKKLSAAAKFTLPERRIEEMINAGLLHLDVVAFGEEPSGTVLPAIGVYTAIGSESSPIVQFMDSMGWNDLAERSLQFFLDKQHEDGFIQNFNEYMLETGAALWSIGEHYRYTRDDEWVVRVKPNLLKAKDYIMAWRERNQTEALRGKGYGMLEGKTADPEDPYHSFMLNGYAYIGLSRLSELLITTDPEASAVIQEEAEAFRIDIREAFERAVALSPVVPIGDGSWVPTAPPWVEDRGPLSLHTKTGKWLTHGAATARDSLLGPLYLVLQEVVGADEASASWMLNYHSELMCVRNVALSQPYYSIHPWVHLKRGEVKPFLKTYYNGFAGLADRETYTFWEHYWHASPHKTHEEGWFLMQTRWMLYMEEGSLLNLLPGIPRAWMKDGSVIAWEGAHTYFGPTRLKVESNLSEDVIKASFHCMTDRKPNSVLLRLPHPEGAIPVGVTGGLYIPEKEAVLIESFEGQFEVILHY
ncbi:hypothetical protein [Paenibacillus spongiae]|uniref:Cellobiose phosphorylase n=1 Tax=Paenibacillus spongiae TaxID=2909671 RepID=A0ABY5S0X4_9BACL|nr:hypothetical protein [Paenibacillus spongiae]UVI27504.1 hypothetical protein L1F29_18725 [Paenibacillus spongiae]